MSATEPKRGENFASSYGISLYPRHKRWLRELADKHGMSESRVVRRLIEAARRMTALKEKK